MWAYLYRRHPPVRFCLTGPVGVGKTTIATELSELLGQIRQAHALLVQPARSAIDLDWLRWCYPSPVGDPFQLALGLQNLAAQETS
jgi:predicted ATPase